MNLQVDRLALRLTGWSEVDGRRLAQLVGEGLQTAAPPAAARRVNSVRMTLVARPGETLEETAHRIVAEMLRVLVRSL